MVCDRFRTILETKRETLYSSLFSNHNYSLLLNILKYVNLQFYVLKTCIIIVDSLLKNLGVANFCYIIVRMADNISASFILPVGQSVGRAQLTIPSQNNCVLTHCPDFPHFWQEVLVELQDFLNGVTTRDRVFWVAMGDGTVIFTQISISWSEDSEYILFDIGVTDMGSSALEDLLVVGKLPLMTPQYFLLLNEVIKRMSRPN